LSDFKETGEFSQTIFKNHSNTKQLKSIQWEHSCSIGMDGHDEANSRFPQLFESAPKRMHVHVHTVVGTWWWWRGKREGKETTCTPRRRWITLKLLLNKGGESRLG
jgi:hypothetical protein